VKSTDWLKTLSEPQRRAYVFGLCYEKVRRETAWGYKLWPERSSEIKLTSVLKTCTTVVRWLDEQGFQVTWREVHWQGYVSFVFRYMHPTVPMVGQLKNRKLLSLYIQSAPQKEVKDTMTQRELMDAYKSVLDPDVASNGAWLGALGLHDPS